MKSIATVILVLVGFLGVPGAYAGVHFAAQGAADVNSSGYGFVSSPSILLGAALTMDVGYPFQAGIVYQSNSLSYNDGGDGGDLKFYGLTGRMRTLSPFFFDLQVGIDKRDSYGPSFSWGFGSGYNIPLMSSIDFAPRLGYRFVPDDGIERSLVDLGAVLTFKFN
jgi:hypothetical protein